VDFSQTLVILAILIFFNGFLSMSEIALAGARKLKLKAMADNGITSARQVLAMQEQPGNFFAASQVWLNAMAILGGIIGEAAFTHHFMTLIGYVYKGEYLHTISFILSFSTVTSLYILFADLMPKRLALMAPEKIACKIIKPLSICIKVCQPLSSLFNGAANGLFHLFKVKPPAKDEITFEDISAIVDAGTLAGVLHKQEQYMIENVFELESRTLPSTMTLRENIIYFSLTEDEKSIRQKLAEHTHSKYLICDKHIDKIVGYIDSKDILLRILNNEPLQNINDTNMRNVLMVPDTLTLSEILDKFKSTRQDFAVVLNEYALVMGLITLNDVMSTVMGNLLNQEEIEQQIVARDDNSWLIDGATSIDDVKRALNLANLHEEENYETIAGFMMYMLRKIPKRTDFVETQGLKFEVVDIDNYKIDQLLVTRSLNNNLQ
jgi:CBS domain containing-hemolysin-like protein